MKYNFVTSAMAFLLPLTTYAHDGALHTTTWYQFLSLPALATTLVLAGIVGMLSYYYQFGTLLSSGAALTVVAIGFASMYHVPMQTASAPTEVIAQLEGVHMTLHRTPGCSCCNAYADELKRAGALVTVETLEPQAMQQLKETHGISRTQESCHTTMVEDYVVEGHVPFAAIGQLLVEQPSTTGITLPGMPIGTPGMPGRQTEVYEVQTLEGELFWRSS